MKPFAILFAAVLTFASTDIAQAQEKLKFHKDEIVSFNLNRARATEVVKILNEQFFDTFSANTATNVIYGRVPENVLPEVRKFIDELEEMAVRRQDEQRMQRDEEMRERQKGAEEAKARQEADAKLRLEVIRLKFIKSIDAFNAIKDLGFNNRLAVTMEPHSNSLVARGDDESLEAIKKLINLLDVPSDAVTGDDVASEQADAASQELLVLKTELHELSRHFGNDHPKVQLLRQKIEATQEFIDLNEQLDLLPAQQSRRDPLTISGYGIAERKAATLALQWRKENEKKESDPRKLKELEATVKEQVRLAFETRQRSKILELERAAEQLETIRTRLDNREKLADEIISRRVQDLIRGDDLTWLSGQAAAANPDGKVVIDALDNGIIMLRGAKADVEKVKKTIQMVEQKTVRKSQRIGGIVRVNEDEEIALLSIGTDDGLQVGDAVEVARGGKIIGQLQVVSVAPDHASARIEATKDGAPIGPGDEIKVMTGGGEPAPPRAETQCPAALKENAAILDAGGQIDKKT